MQRYAVIAIALQLIHVSNAAQDVTGEWSYSGSTGPSFWPALFPQDCAGREQSPIDITTRDVFYYPQFSRFLLDSSDAIRMKIQNNGHHIVAISDETNNVNLGFLTGGPLPDGQRYAIAEIRLHFDGEGRQGSEHTVDGSFFAGEMQLVAYNTRYRSLKMAANMTYGVAIVAIMLQERPRNNNADINMFLDTASEVKYRGMDAVLEGIRLRQFMPRTNSTYYTYRGSFTWPGCCERVRWIVMQSPLNITAEQVSNLRQVCTTSRTEEPHMTMGNNIRPAQRLNGRLVLSSFEAVPGLQLQRDCLHRNEFIGVGQVKEFTVRTGGGDNRASSDGADIFFVIDQSGSTANRRTHRWLRESNVSRLIDQYLRDNNFGADPSSPNRFGLVGFGQDKPAELAIAIPVGSEGQRMGSAANFQEALSQLVSRGMMEDGYAGLQLALSGFSEDRRPNSPCIVVLVTDEGRTTMAPNINRSLIAKELRERSCTLHAMVNERFVTGNIAQRPFVFGSDFDRNGFVLHPNGQIEVVSRLGRGRPESGYGNTHTAYVTLALSSQGAAWDLMRLVGAGFQTSNSLANAFARAFSQIRLRDFWRFTCERCHCTLDGQVQCMMCSDFPPQAAIVYEETVFLGESTTMRCIGSGQPKPAVSWFTADGSLVPSGIVVMGNVLRIPSVRTEMCFKCVASTFRRGLSEATACVGVQGVEPAPSVSPASPDINIGADLTFTCEDQNAYPSPSLEWSQPPAGCIADGNRLLCTNIRTRICATCISSSRLGESRATQCVNLHQNCASNHRHNSYRRLFTPSASIPADNAYIVVIFDESRSMAAELQWLRTGLDSLDSSLVSAAFGTSSPNRFSVIGFAGTQNPQGNVVPIGGGVCGSADEAAIGLSQLQTDGRIEDGYSAINEALSAIRQCNAGANAQTVFLLFTDEDRDTLRGVGEAFTYQNTLSKLNDANVRLITIIKQDYVDNRGRLAYGIGADGTAYVSADSGSGVQESTGGVPIPDSAFGTTNTDYTNLALATGGASFSTNTLRRSLSQDDFTDALGAAVRRSVAEERVRPLCQECRCDNGTQRCSNLIEITSSFLCSNPTTSGNIQVVTTPDQFATAFVGQPLRLSCSGTEEGNAVAATEWNPHPVGAFQESNGALYFNNYPGQTGGLVSYICTKRSASGQASKSIDVVTANPVRLG